MIWFFSLINRHIDIWWWKIVIYQIYRNNGLSSRSCCAPEVYIDFDAIGDGDWGDIFDLLGGALQVDVPLVDGHLEIVPGFGAFAAGWSSGADAEMFVGESDGSLDLDLALFGVADELVSDRLDGLQPISTEGDSCLLDVLIFENFFLFFICH